MGTKPKPKPLIFEGTIQPNDPDILALYKQYDEIEADIATLLKRNQDYLDMKKRLRGHVEQQIMERRKNCTHKYEDGTEATSKTVQPRNVLTHEGIHKVANCEICGGQYKIAMYTVADLEALAANEEPVKELIDDWRTEHDYGDDEQFETMTFQLPTRVRNANVHDKLKDKVVYMDENGDEGEVNLDEIIFDY